MATPDEILIRQRELAELLGPARARRVAHLAEWHAVDAVRSSDEQLRDARAMFLDVFEAFDRNKLQETTRLEQREQALVARIRREMPEQGPGPAEPELLEVAFELEELGDAHADVQVHEDHERLGRSVAADRELQRRGRGRSANRDPRVERVPGNQSEQRQWVATRQARLLDRHQAELTEIAALVRTPALADLYRARATDAAREAAERRKTAEDYATAAETGQAIRDRAAAAAEPATPEQAGGTEIGA